MQSLPNLYAQQVALLQLTDETLYRLIADRIADAIACGCEQLTHILIVESGDGEGDFQREAAFTPFHNPLSGWRYGDACFEPYWDWAGRNDGWFEWLTCIGNDGFAFIVLVPDRDGINPALLTMLQEFVPCA